MTRKRPQSARPRRDPSSAGAPKVGIFWLVGNRLVLASTPLDKAESNVEFRNFPASHVKFWEKLQRDGKVPRDVEYEDAPRGRVVYNTRTRQFTLFADRCISRSKRLVARIVYKLNLPKDTKVRHDEHYRCAKCMRERFQEKDL